MSVRFHPGSKTYYQSHLPVQPVARRLMTRLLAIIPSTIVAVVAGRTGIDVLLVASQVVLSIVLPFVVIPLVYLTSSKSIMSVRRERSSTLPEGEATPQELESAAEYEMVDFSSGKVVTAIGSLICLIITLANVYVIISLGINS
jgi:metal iron transporter